MSIHKPETHVPCDPRASRVIGPAVCSCKLQSDCFRRVRRVSFDLDPTTLAHSRLKNACTTDTATPESRQKAVAQNHWAHDDHDAVQCMSENHFTENWLLAGCSGCQKYVLCWSSEDCQSKTTSEQNDV